MLKTIDTITLIDGSIANNLMYRLHEKEVSGMNRERPFFVLLNKLELIDGLEQIETGGDWLTLPALGRQQTPPQELVRAAGGLLGPITRAPKPGERAPRLRRSTFLSRA